MFMLMKFNSLITFLIWYIIQRWKYNFLKLMQIDIAEQMKLAGKHEFLRCHILYVIFRLKTSRKVG